MLAGGPEGTRPSGILTVGRAASPLFVVPHRLCLKTCALGAFRDRLFKKTKIVRSRTGGEHAANRVLKRPVVVDGTDRGGLGRGLSLSRLELDLDQAGA
jgi:hypothetical protein